MSKPTDWQALCAELIEIVEEHCNPDEYALLDVVNVLSRARTLLSQPEPEGVGDEGRELQWPPSVAVGCHEAAVEAEPGSPLQQLLIAAGDLLESRWCRPTIQPEPQGPTDEGVEAAARVIYGSMRFDRVDHTAPWVERGNSFAQDEARRCARAVLTRYARPTIQPVPVRLAWSEVREPCEECRYNHCIAETPFGRILISWKGWKNCPAITPDEVPWSDSWFPVWSDLEKAKAECEAEYSRRIALAFEPTPTP